MLTKQIYLCALVPFLNGCTSPTVDTADSLAAIDSGVEVNFVESAPKDSFVITNIGSCRLEAIDLTLDLAPSAGQLIFDTSATGAGVEVFQPFEVVEGDIVQLAAEGVTDGDTELSLRIASLAPGGRAKFTIDVDDTLPAGELGQIRVADSEMSGAIVSITVNDAEVTSAKFDSGSVARVDLPSCGSAQ